MTKRLTVFQTRKSLCRSCGNEFKERLTGPGKPPIYCRRCRKDYELYPGASRAHRERLKAGEDLLKSHRRAMNDIRDQVMGPREPEPEGGDL